MTLNLVGLALVKSSLRRAKRRSLVGIVAVAVVGAMLQRSALPQDHRASMAQRGGPKKKALLIGVSKYDRGGKNHEYTDWWDLTSDVDVDALAKVLAAPRFGFQVKVLKTPAETSHQAIVSSIRTWLIGTTQPGDIVFLHYSGHGSQAPDTDTPDNPIVGDEISGLDQTLVPSDYVSMQDPSRDIRDDEIGILLKELDKKSPSQVFLSFDTCHSGSITRGSGRYISRGKQWTGPKPLVTSGTKKLKTRGGFIEQDHARAHGYVVLEASRDDQLAHQLPTGTRMGLLTFALIKALNASGPRTTYRDIYYQVSSFVSSHPADQDPQMEGDDIDNIFLTTIKTPVQNSMPVFILAGREMWLGVGELQGISKGSKFSVFASGKHLSDATPGTDAFVDAVELTRSRLVLSRVDKKKQRFIMKSFEGGTAIERLHLYGDNRLRVESHLITSLSKASEIKSALRALPLVDLRDDGVDEWDIRVCPKPCPALGADPGTSAQKLVGRSPEADDDTRTILSVQRADGSILAERPADLGLAESLRTVLERESRWRFVNSLSNNNATSDVTIEIRVVPLETETVRPCGPIRKIVRDRPLSNHVGRMTIAVCDFVAIELRNTGKQEAFVSVFELQNNGTIGPVWPHPRHDVADNRIPNDNQWHRLPPDFTYMITKPLGLEMFKAIATTAQTDFSRLVDTDSDLQRTIRPKEVRAAESPLGQLLRAAARGQRSPISMVGPSEWATASVVVEVVDRMPTNSGPAEKRARRLELNERN